MLATQIVDRRAFLRASFFAAGGTVLAGCSSGGAGTPSTQNVMIPPILPPNCGLPNANTQRFAEIGALQAPDANGIRLPAGFSSRVVATSGQVVAGTSYTWHTAPDAAGCFATMDGGWIYVVNSEAPSASGGGASAIKFDSCGVATNAYRVLSNTTNNCAGGITPWGTWFSCEETPNGYTWECDPTGALAGVRRDVLGVFNHEAACVDPINKIIYSTEDAGDGRFYRFVPTATDWPLASNRPALQNGVLQVLKYQVHANNTNAAAQAGFDVKLEHDCEWVDVSQPTLPQAGVRSLLNGFPAPAGPAPGAIFTGGEGLWYFNGVIYFSTKGDNRIWAYTHTGANTGKIQCIYHFDSAPAGDKILSGVDNLVVSQYGDVIVAEDGGDMQLCVILPDRRVLPLLQVTQLDGSPATGSELTGPCFSPDGRRLYFSAQRGRDGGNGITFEILLPFAA